MSEDDKPDLMIERVVDAPLDRVWRAWTDPSELQKWWGPRGVTIIESKWDPHVGGHIGITMLAGKELGQMAGMKWPMDGRFADVIPNQKLQFTTRPLMNGNPIMETLCTVTFEQQGDKTKLKLQIVITEKTTEAEGPLAGMKMGWNQSIDKLNEFLN